MRKTFNVAVFIILICVLLFPRMNVKAYDNYEKNVYQSMLNTEDIEDINIVYNIDGSTDVIVTYLSEVKTFLIGDRSYNTKTTEKAWYHLEGVDITCKAKLVATFLYDGSSALCIASNDSYEVYDSDWYLYSSSSGRSGNTAYSSFVFKQYSTGKREPGSLSISCSENGTTY